MNSSYKNNRTYFLVCTLIIFTLAVISSVAISADKIEKNDEVITQAMPF